MDGQEAQAQRIEVPEAQKEQVLRNEHKQMKLIGMDRFWEHIKNKYSNIKRSEVREIVSKNPNNQRHQPVRQKKSSRVIIAEKPLERWQIDLTDYRLPQNGFIIVVIDIYSRKIWAKFIRSKHARKIAEFLEALFQQETCKILQSDNGTEFKNETVAAVCNAHEVKQIFSSTYTPTSQAYVERAHRTIKGTLERLKTAHQPVNLQSVVDAYNNTWHRSIKTTPNKLHAGQVSEEEKKKIIRRKVNQSNRIIGGVGDELEPGDIVRVALQKDEDRKLNKDLFEKGYVKKWSAETFVIHNVVHPRSKHEQLQPPAYYHLAGKGNRIYYRQDLLKIPS